MSLSSEQAAASFVTGDADLPHAGGVAAQVASEAFVESLARVVFYWGYPGVDAFGRTNMWPIMAGRRGTMLGILPAGPKNHTGGLGDYMSPAQRWVVSPNNDTIYGAGFADLSSGPVVVQTPGEVPDGHYWTVQIVDVLTNVVHQLGSASGTPTGKFLLVGPDWTGDEPDGFLGVLRMPTNIAAVLPRAFAARTGASKRRARAVLDQIGMYPVDEDRDGPRDFAYSTHATHKVFPDGVTEQMLAAEPEASRPDWVKPATFWDVFVDGRLTLHLRCHEPVDPDARANWLPAPEGPFCLAFRAYVPTEDLIEGTYRLPDVVRAAADQRAAPTITRH